MKKQWLTIAVMVGALGALSAQMLQSTAVWAGGAGALVQSSTSKRHDYTDRLIVKLRDKQVAQATTMSPKQMISLSASAGVALAHVRAMSGDAQVLQLAQRMPLADVEAIARRLSADPQVEYAEPDRILQPLLAPNDALYANQWNLRSPSLAAGSANLQGAWDITTGSASVVVAVIDTGLVPHADIDSNILDGTGRVLPGYDFVSPDASGIFYSANDGNGRDADPTDPGDWITAAEDAGTDPVSGTFFQGCGAANSSWHGTHVAGIIGAIGNNGTGVAGINWASKILPVRVVGKCGAYLSDVVDGVRWAAGITVNGATNANPAKVLNISLGGPGACGSAEQTAINDVVNTKGAVVVVAAGNDNVDLVTSPESPASCTGVITVAAVNKAGGRAYYSNYGTTVEIAAPGGDQRTISSDGIQSTVNGGLTSPVASPLGDGYAYYSGTSMATPHVTGVVSLMLSVNPGLTPSQVLTVLQSSARPFPTGTALDCTLTTCGAGLLDAAAAVTAAAAAVTPALIGPLTPSPTLVNFGAVAVSSSASQTITFTNTSTNTTPVVLSTPYYTITGTNQSEFSVTSASCADGFSIAKAGSCTATVTFTPTVLGLRSAELVISSNATVSPVRVALAGGIAPAVSVTATDAAAAEAGPDPGTFTISRTGATTSPLTVNFTLGGTAINGTDYTVVPSSSAVVIPAGATTATVTITPISDTLVEGSETVDLLLNGSAAYNVDSASKATVTIADNPPPPPPPAKSGGGGCFIATAAYGTPMAENVRYLRAFRDQYLQTNEAGRWFVSQYYKYSPPLADYLRQHDDLRAVVRTALGPLVGLSRAVVDDSALAAETADRP
jgi:serine protease